MLARPGGRSGQLARVCCHLRESESLCLIPWIHRYTNEQGYHLLCCSGHGETNMLRSAAGEPLHVSQGLTDAELLNSPDLKSVRQTMLRGRWPAACERCQRTEAAGSDSVRKHVNKRFAKWTERVLDDTQPDGALENPVVRYADIRLGNTCNLTCRMCGPKASRLWADHYNAVSPKGFQVSAQQLASFRDDNWVKSQPVHWLMEQCLPSIESLHFAGGEPLIIPEMVELLEQCVASGRADQIDLSYNTNLTVLPDKVTRLWPSFRKVSIQASMDGFGPVNDYIRRPSHWKDIDRNLRTLDDNFEKWKLASVSAAVTVQIYNILQLGELFDYLGSGFRRVSPVPLLTALYEPAYLSIQILPAAAKELARERLLLQSARLNPLLGGQFHSQVLSIDSILAYLDEAAPQGQLPHFLYFSEMSDRQFGQSWRESCPELARTLMKSRTSAPRRPGER